ncbi:MAG: efflux RND transporter periplasmic adaptor subunit [Acidobacteriota bacterium]
MRAHRRSLSAPTLSCLLLVLALLLSGCGRGSTAQAGTTSSDSRPASTSSDDATSGRGADDTDAANDDEDAEDERVPVEIDVLARGPIESVLRFSTNLEAEQEVQVFAEAARRIVALEVEEGDRVRKGTLLVRLQDDAQRSRLAQVRQELDKAEREYKRQSNLYEQQLISEQAYNDATFEVERLTLSLADAERELSYTEVRAPISGTITARMVDLGDYVTVNQRLFDMVDFDSIVARIFVPERELTQLSVGQDARLYATGLGDAMRTAEVLRIAPVVDPRSGTVKVTVALPDAAARQALRPGMYVEIDLVMQRYEDALLVPKRAVVYDDNQAYLYRVVDGDDQVVAERMRIAPTIEDREHVTLGADDARIAVGNRVVIAGQAGLRDGVAVRI